MLAVFWTAIAASILIKGPLILMVVGLAALALSVFERSARWLLALRPLPGLLWLLLIVLPWFIAIYMRVGREFLVASVGEDMLAKVANSQEAHGAPPGLYLVLFFVTFFPASILAGLAAPAIWAVRKRAGGEISPGLAGAVLDRVRTGRDQAAALRAAALSRHRHSHRGSG